MMMIPETTINKTQMAQKRNESPLLSLLIMKMMFVSLYHNKNFLSVVRRKESICCRQIQAPTLCLKDRSKCVSSQILMITSLCSHSFTFSPYKRTAVCLTFLHYFFPPSPFLAFLPLPLPFFHFFLFLFPSAQFATLPCLRLLFLLILRSVVVQFTSFHSFTYLLFLPLTCLLY